jgi:hypothetical protein
MSWEKDMSAVAMTDEPVDATAENTWHGFGSERTTVLPFDEMVAFCLGNAVDGDDSAAAKGKRRSPLVTPAELLLLVIEPHGNWPLFSAAELGPLVEFFRGGNVD